MTITEYGITKNFKKYTGLALKMGFSAMLILWLIKRNRLDLAVLNNLSLDMHTLLLILGGSVSVFCGLLLLGFRLWLLLRYKRFSVTYKRALGITLMGSFLGVVLPGLVGGDAVKAGYLFINVSERRMDVLSTVFVDRIFGLYSLLFLGASAVAVSFAVDAFQFDRVILLTAPTVVALLSIGIFVISRDNVINLYMIKWPYLPVPKRIQGFLNSLKGYLKSPKLIIMAVVISILNHVFVVLSFVIAAILIKDKIPILSHLILDPLAMVMNMIPVTPGGLGMAESAFSLLYQSVDSSGGAIIGLMGRFIQYFVFILSGSIALTSLRLQSHIFSLENKTPSSFLG